MAEERVRSHARVDAVLLSELVGEVIERGVRANRRENSDPVDTPVRRKEKAR